MSATAKHQTRYERLAAQQAARRSSETAANAPIVMFDAQVADLAEIRAEQIDFAHLASTLSKVSRFNGRHQGAAVSVAQHCVMGADALFRENGDAVLAGYFLLHDGHEYLLGDIGRPVVVEFDLRTAAYLVERGVPAELAHGAVAEGIKRAKAALDAPILAAARLPPIAPVYARLVAEMDERMGTAEARALYGSRTGIPLVRNDLPPPQLTGAIEPWGAMKAELAFLERLQRYLGIAVRA